MDIKHYLDCPLNIPDAGREPDLSEPPLPMRGFVLLLLKGRFDPAGDAVELNMIIISV